MMGTTHATVGAVAWLTLGPLLPNTNPASVIALVPIAAFAALGPDIDHPNSLISKILGPFGWLLRKFTTHRVETHSILSTLAVIALVAPTAGPVAAAAVATGWGIGHIGADCLTVQGCALFWPLTREKTGFGFIRTNHWSERIFAFAVPFGFAWWLLWRITN
jgi:inner membrane protein